MAAIPSKQFYEMLIDKGIDEIFHANSVATACLFLKTKSLMSRGTVERYGLKQTPQKSDLLDKRFSIWFDVFVDTVDIHRRARRPNEYGPVNFVLDTDIIKKTVTGRIWATKSNPMYWKRKPDSLRWFQNIDDLHDNFTKGTFEHMIVFRHCGGELPFGKFLKKIIIDDPRQRNDDRIELFSMAYGALRAAMADSGINIPIERRVCNATCLCRNDYDQDIARTELMFDPLIE